MNKRSLIGFASVLALFLPAFASDHYAIQIRNAPLDGVIRLLAYLDHSNVVLPSHLDDTVTASFESVTIDDALNSVLDSKDLGVVRKVNVLRVTGKKAIMELGEDLRTAIMPLKYAKAQSIGSQIKPLVSPRGAVMIDDRTNTISVRDAPQYLHDIQMLVEKVDHPDRQVLIEARIVQANSSFLQNLGVKWGVNYTPVGQSPLNSVGINHSTPLDDKSAFTTGAIKFNPLAGLSLDMTLSAAEQNGNGTVLARPSVVATNNQAASLKSGQKIYVVAPGNISIGTAGGSASSSSGLQTIDAGISLVVTPQITPDNKISLNIQVTQSEPDYANAVEGLPTINDNTASTTVMLEDGQTTVIGGLFKSSTSHSMNGLPWLNRIPIIGHLFGQSMDKNDQKELVVFITPSIIKQAVQRLKGYNLTNESEKNLLTD